jgi:predicted protein tyrosine phosphatase
MPRIHVCSLRRLPQTVTETGARDVVTLMKNVAQVATPHPVMRERHLALDFSDIVVPTEGQVLASEAQVIDLLHFVKRWDRAAPLVVHCYAGVSRSTAGAFITACALRPDQPEAVWATTIRAQSPTATPNLHLVTLADRLLAREGRMIAAIKSIGPGEDAAEGVPFSLEIGPAG